MELGGFSSQEELQEWVDNTLREADILTYRALSLFLQRERERRSNGEQK